MDTPGHRTFLATGDRDRAVRACFPSARSVVIIVMVTACWRLDSAMASGVRYVFAHKNTFLDIQLEEE